MLPGLAQLALRTTLNSLPIELIEHILSLLVLHVPLPNFISTVRYRLLLPLVRLRLFREPAQFLLAHHVFINGARPAQLYAQTLPKFISPTRSLEISTSFTTAPLDYDAIFRRATGVQHLKLGLYSRIEDSILSSPSLSDVTTLELHATLVEFQPTVIQASAPLDIPFSLHTLILRGFPLANDLSPRLWFQLLDRSSTTLKSLHLNLEGWSLSHPLLLHFHRVASSLESLTLKTTSKVIPPALMALFEQCSNLTSLHLYSDCPVPLVPLLELPALTELLYAFPEYIALEVLKEEGFIEGIARLERAKFANIGRRTFEGCEEGTKLLERCTESGTKLTFKIVVVDPDSEPEEEEGHDV